MEKKSLFNFYLDEETKRQASTKITELCGVQNKGQLASLIRVLLKDFIECDNQAQLINIAVRVEKEYAYTTKKNKRSSL